MSTTAPNCDSHWAIADAAAQQAGWVRPDVEAFDRVREVAEG